MLTVALGRALEGWRTAGERPPDVVTEVSSADREEPEPRWIYRVVLADGTVEYDGPDEGHAQAVMEAFAGARLTRHRE